MMEAEHPAGVPPDLAEVVELELKLLDPAVRRDRSAMEDLLHPDFREVGASGQAWDRESLIDALARAEGESAAAVRLAARPVSSDVVLVTYLAVSASGRRSLRSSLWVRKDGWRVLFHQGTPAEEENL